LFYQFSALVYALQADTDLLARLVQIDPNHSHPFKNTQLLVEYDIDDIKLFSELLDCVKGFGIGISPNLEFLSSCEQRVG
jgi:hypothetical protein